MCHKLSRNDGLQTKGVVLRANFSKRQFPWTRARSATSCQNMLDTQGGSDNALNIGLKR